MNATYSELRQRAYFRAARDLLSVASMILDDVQNPVELASESTLMWARQTAKYTAERAYELFSTGEEQCICPSRLDTVNYKAKRSYTAACDAFEARVKEAKEEAAKKPPACQCYRYRAAGLTCNGQGSASICKSLGVEPVGVPRRSGW